MKIFLLLIITFYNTTLLAQAVTNENEPIIWELKTFLANQRAGEQNSKNESSSDTPNALDLLHKLQPSVYFYDGKVKTYGEKPSNLFTDVGSLIRVNDFPFEKNHIKIVTIKIRNNTDLNSTIDLSVFSNFKNLKYIYIVSGISATEQNIKGMIRNGNGKLSVFYKIDKGDNNQQY